MRVKNYIGLLFVLALIGTILSACRQEASPSKQKSETTQEHQIKKESTDMPILQEQKELKLEINGQAIQVSWENNVAVEALKGLVGDNGLTLPSHDYGRMEKVVDLPNQLPSANQYMETEAGDITLYQGTDLSFYYAPNSYSLTPIGKIEGMTKEEIRQLLTQQDQPSIRLTLE